MTGRLARAAGIADPLSRAQIEALKQQREDIEGGGDPKLVLERVDSAFRALQADGVVTVRTKRPLVPMEAEIDRNPRARSAKLRVVQRK